MAIGSDKPYTRPSGSSIKRIIWLGVLLFLTAVGILLVKRFEIAPPVQQISQPVTLSVK